MKREDNFFNMPHLHHLKKGLLDPVVSTFGLQNILTFFIAGSVAEGSAGSLSDLDIFICLKKQPSVKQRKLFNRQYIKLHGDLQLIPDLAYPGEIMSIDELSRALKAAAQDSAPTRHLHDSLLYDGLVWAGMLYAKKLLLIKSREFPRELESLSHTILAKWYSKTAGNSTFSGNNSRSIDKQLKHIVHYEPLTV